MRAVHGLAVFGRVVFVAIVAAGCKTPAGGPGQAGQPPATPAKASAEGFRDVFTVNRADLADSGENPYFLLTPGYRLTYRDGRDTLTITVLGDTKVVDGVRTRVVEERETKGGRLAEVSRNFFAIDRKTKDVHYFGEEVDGYRDDKVVGHGGAWLSGVNGARFGLMMPGQPRVGDKFYQELAPQVAMDRCEVVSLTERLKVPAGEFTDVLVTTERSAVERGSEKKWHAPGVGLLRDGDFELAKIERP